MTGGGWRIILGLALAALPAAGAARAADLPLYKDTTQPFEKRAADLVARMNIQQKAEQMQVQIPADTELGISGMKWGMEGLHGLNGGTVYPDAMAMAATFDPELV